MGAIFPLSATRLRALLESERVTMSTFLTAILGAGIGAVRHGVNLFALRLLGSGSLRER